MRRTCCLGIWLAVVLLGAAPLLAAGADAPLADAVQRMDHAAVGDLLQDSTDINAPQVDGMTALHWAAYHGRRGSGGAARERWRRCARSQSVRGDAALARGGERQRRHGRAVTRYRGGSDTTLPGGETVLMTAARTGRVGAVRALIAAGADLEADESARGQTALMWAVAEGTSTWWRRSSRPGRSSAVRSNRDSLRSCSPSAKDIWASC